MLLISRNPVVRSKIQFHTATSISGTNEPSNQSDRTSQITIQEQELFPVQVLATSANTTIVSISTSPAILNSPPLSAFATTVPFFGLSRYTLPSGHQNNLFGDVEKTLLNEHSKMLPRRRLMRKWSGWAFLSVGLRSGGWPDQEERRHLRRRVRMEASVVPSLISLPWICEVDQ